MKSKKSITCLLEAFFKERLMSQKQVSPHTIASYSNTFQLLLKFAVLRLKKPASSLCLESFNAALISKFLDDLEKRRNISPRSRNSRLAAIRSFFKYLSTEVPEAGALINGVLAIPAKRTLQKTVSFLSDLEVRALLSAPNQETWLGRRDHMLLVLAIHTGFRLSELLELRLDNITWGQKICVSCIGKGRKCRTIPLSKQASACLRAWVKDLGQKDILFPTIHGQKMSSDSV
jgi:site-specific recombinase XerD